MATPTDSPTGRNLAATRAVRLGLGHTRDVSMIEGEVEVLEIDALPQERGDRFVAGEVGTGAGSHLREETARSSLAQNDLHLAILRVKVNHSLRARRNSQLKRTLWMPD